MTSRLLVPWFSIFSLMILVAACAQGQTAFVGDQLDPGTLYTLDLQTGALEAFGDGDIGIDFPPSALAARADGRLLAAVDVLLPITPPPQDRLYEVDLDSGDFGYIGPLGLFFPEISDMAAGPNGELWMAAQLQLWSVDPTTADVTSIGGTDIQGIVWSQGRLWGALNNGTDPEWQLAEIDPNTGAASGAVEVAAFEGAHRLQLDEDDGAQIWALGSFTQVLFPPPGPIDTTLFRIDDPSTPAVELVFVIDDALLGFAIGEPPSGVIDVPVLGHTALALLASLVLVAALIVIRRR